MPDLFTASVERTVRVWQRTLLDPLARLLPVWITPHRLTGLRLGLAGAVAQFLLRERLFPALLCYALALATDALDGAVARQRGSKTRWGARLDPTVDKVLHAVLFFAFLPSAPALFIALLLVDGLLLVLGSLVLLWNQDASASPFGKWKLTLQAVGFLGLFWNQLFPAAVLPFPVVVSVFGLALICAVLSAVGYVERFAFRSQPSLH